jgi:hypothetical protein
VILRIDRLMCWAANSELQNEQICRKFKKITDGTNNKYKAFRVNGGTLNSVLTDRVMVMLLISGTIYNVKKMLIAYVLLTYLYRIM